MNDKTLAIIPTHLGGRIADVLTAKYYAEQVGAYVIEDAAQALGAIYRGESVGLQGDAGFFSLAAGKGLSTYEGGVLITRHEKLRQGLQRMHEQIIPTSWWWELRRNIEFLGYTALYHPRGLYYAYGQPLRKALQRGDPVSAVGDDFDVKIPLHSLGKWRSDVGGRAATRLPEFLQQSRAQALKRCQQLNDVGITVITDKQNEQDQPLGVWPFLMVMMPGQTTRDHMLNKLWQSGLGVSRLFIHALPDYAYLKNIVPQVDVPYARDFASRMLTLSNSLWLDDLKFDSILETLKSVR